MGSGIAHTTARAGFTTIVREINRELLNKGIGNIYKRIERAVSKGKAEASEIETVKRHLSGTTELHDFSTCDLIIEAVPEKLELKRELFSELDKITGGNAIFATNTSSLKVSDIAEAVNRRDRFIGLHFFNPAPVMKLVEVIRTDDTSDETYKTCIDFVGKIGKTAVTCKDTTGFVVNRLLTPYLLDAVRALEAGTASVKDIDNGMKLGCGYPMGPLTLIDFIGVETVNHIAHIMHEEFKQPQYEPPKLLRKMVDKGWLGKKSGKGFYNYSGEEPAANDDDLMNLLK